MKLATVGNGSAVHIFTSATYGGTTYENTLCGAVETGGNALYGHRPRKLNVFESDDAPTCQRCIKSAASTK